MLPGWLAAGLAIAGALAVVFAAVFVAAERLSPTPRAGERGGGRERGADDHRRRAEIRAYLDGIGERFVEDHAVAGETVAFYLPERDVAIAFDPRAYFRIGETATTAILVEHELPGAGLGARLPFDVPSGGATREASRQRAGEDPDAAVPAAFETLGVDPGAGPEEIRQAYRERVKDVHPDHGGDERAFRRVREAYATATSHAG